MLYIGSLCQCIVIKESLFMYLRSQILNSPESEPEAKRFEEIWFQEITLTSVEWALIEEIGPPDLVSIILIEPSVQAQAIIKASFKENYKSSMENRPKFI